MAVVKIDLAQTEIESKKGGPIVHFSEFRSYTPRLDDRQYSNEQNDDKV